MPYIHTMTHRCRDCHDILPVEVTHEMNTQCELIQKAGAIIADSDAMTLAYIREDGYPRASTISLLKAEGLRRLYAATAMQSPKAKRIQANPKVSLCFRAGGNNVTLTGTVEVTQDNAVRQAIWQYWCIDHFPDGPLGESFCVFVFTTEEAAFWIDGASGAVGRGEL